VVQPPDERRRRQGRPDVEMCDLPERVHAGVRAPRPVELEPALAGNLPDRAIELSLHGAGVLLDLPPAVPGSGVFEEEAEAGHAAETGPRNRLDNTASLRQ